ncbi:glycosyltransferase family 4 protein, partial [bacterium]|nr:glycosyltransferase family 4 protein [bacterium]
MAKAKVLISTQNPIIGGGVGSMRKSLGIFLSHQGFNVTYTFPSRGFHEMLRSKNLHLMEVDGINALKAKSVPYIHLIEHFVAYFPIRKLLKQFDIYQALGGSNFPALPFVLGNKPFVCWVATTIEDEDRLIFDNFNPFESFTRSLLYGLYYIFKPLFYKFEGHIYKKASKIIALSNYTASLIQKQFKISEEKIVVIPFPVDTAKFKPNDNSDRSIEDDFIIMVGRITDPRKNIRLLLDSFSIIKKQFPEIELIIIGDNRQSSQVEKLCDKLGIRESIRFLGTLPNEETIKYFTHAKVSILPSYQEGLGIVVLESMACGTPVVSTKCGGPEELIINGENGYLVENNNPVDLAGAVCEILKDTVLRRKMSKKAR